MNRVGVLLVTVLAGLAVLAPAARGETFIVNYQEDVLDCMAEICSLRGAIRLANQTTAPDEITFADLPGGPDVYKIERAGAGENLNDTGDLDVTQPLTIRGNGAANTIIDGDGLDGVIEGVTGTATLDISGVTIRGASAAGKGGVQGLGPRLTLTDSAVRDNRGNYAIGAFSLDDQPTDLTLTRVSVTGNISDVATVAHGPDTDGKLRVVDSQITGNTAPEIIDANPAGGAKAVVEFFGSTFADNTMEDYGIDVNPSGAVTEAVLDVRGSTFRDNDMADAAGLIDFNPSSNSSTAPLTTTLRITDSAFTGLRAQYGNGVLLIDPSASTRPTHLDARIERVRFEDNIVGGAPGQNGSGAAIFLNPSSSGNGNQTILIADSAFLGNQARGENSKGGAIRMNAPAGTVTVARSTFAGNRSGTAGGSANGGAIDAQDGTLEVVNSTFHDNAVGGAGESFSGGGAIHVGGADLRLVHSTVTGNGVAMGAGYAGPPEEGAGGGAIRVGSGSTATVTASILHGNTSFGAGENCKGPLTSGGSNLAGDASCGLAAAGDQQGVGDPGLAALAANGGFAPTRALLEGSPARNAAAASTCVATDQRGVTRPQESACDIGAYEYGGPPPPAPPPPPPPGPPVAGPGPPPLGPPISPPPPPQSLLLSCARSQLALVDVVRAAGRVRITGQAAPSLAGQQVTLFVSSRTKRRLRPVRVGRAVVTPAGTFAATVPKPPRRIRSPQYFARGGGARSTALELDRRMYVDSLRLAAGRVVVSGHVTRPLPAAGSSVSVYVQTDCRTRRRAGKTKLDRRGRFTFSFPAPTGVPEALLRAQTTVPVKKGRRATARTFTLPTPLRLG